METFVKNHWRIVQSKLKTHFGYLTTWFSEISVLYEEEKSYAQTEKKYRDRKRNNSASNSVNDNLGFKEISTTQISNTPIHTIYRELLRRNNSSVTLSDCSEIQNSLDSSDSETKETTRDNPASTVQSKKNHEEEMKDLILGIRQKFEKKENKPATFYSHVYENLMVKMNKSMNMLKLAAIDNKVNNGGQQKERVDNSNLHANFLMKIKTKKKRLQTRKALK